jgi:hypothetical protein
VINGFVEVFNGVVETVEKTFSDASVDISVGVVRVDDESGVEAGDCVFELVEMKFSRAEGDM